MLLKLREEPEISCYRYEYVMDELQRYYVQTVDKLLRPQQQLR